MGGRRGTKIKNIKRANHPSSPLHSQTPIYSPSPFPFRPIYPNQSLFWQQKKEECRTFLLNGPFPSRDFCEFVFFSQFHTSFSCAQPQQKERNTSHAAQKGSGEKKTNILREYQPPLCLTGTHTQSIHGHPTQILTYKEKKTRHWRALYYGQVSNGPFSAFQLIGHKTGAAAYSYGICSNYEFRAFNFLCIVWMVVVVTNFIWIRSVLWPINWNAEKGPFDTCP